MAEETTNRQAGSQPAYHGGGLAAARRRFPGAPEPWLDLSTGINANPYPCVGLDEGAFTRLPEAVSIEALESAAANFYGLGAGGRIVAAPGTQSLIQLLPGIEPAKKVGVLGFTYAEHQNVWALSGAHAQTCATLAELAAFDVAIIVNPNNPDGRLVGVADLLALASKMAARQKLLVVDEAFIDFLPREKSLAENLPLPGVIVLRSFGKTFGLAGLRLGFALCAPDLAGRLREKLGPWAVSGAAVEIGMRAYSDAVWLEQGAAKLESNGARLDGLLRDGGFEMIGGSPLFRLVRHARAQEIFERLCAGGILTRPFAAKPEWLRFGIPHRDEDFRRLAASFRDI